MLWWSLKPLIQEDQFWKALEEKKDIFDLYYWRTSISSDIYQWTVDDFSQASLFE